MEACHLVLCASHYKNIMSNLLQTYIKKKKKKIIKYKSTKKKKKGVSTVNFMYPILCVCIAAITVHCTIFYCKYKPISMYECYNKQQRPRGKSSNTIVGTQPPKAHNIRTVFVNKLSDRHL